MVSEKEKDFQDVKMQGQQNISTNNFFKDFFRENNVLNEKISTEESRTNFFRMALLRYLVEK